MRIGIVFNPQAGPRAARGALGAVVQSIASHSHQLEVLDQIAQPDFERAIRNRAHEFDRVIVIGGDGTLNGVINGVLASDYSELPVAFVPTGRGKDTARSIASWSPHQMANGAFERAQPLQLDLIRITLPDGNIRYGINISDVGLAAHAASVANNLPRFLRSLSYVVGAVRGILPVRSFALDMVIDGEPVHVDNALLLSVCNGSAFGGGIYISPKSDVRDGKLEVVVARNANLGDLALQLPKLKSGTLHKHRSLLRWQAECIDVSPTTTSWYEVDGERLSQQPIRYEIYPSALNWISPE